MSRIVQIAAVRRVFLLVVLGLLGGGVTAQLEIVDPGPPEVVKTNDIVHVSSGSTLTLLCRGNQSLHWSLEDFKDDGRVSFEEVYGENTTYASLLTIANVSLGEEGHMLKCGYNGTSDEVIAYLSVALAESQMFVDYAGVTEFIEWIVGNDGIVPCRVFSPEVNLTLTKDAFPVPTGDDVTYDPQVGFIVANVSARSTGHWECTANLYGHTQQASYIVQAFGSNVPVTLREPQANVTDDGSVAVGTTLVLDCKSQQDRYIFYNLNWTKPTSVIHSGRAKIEQTKLSEAVMKIYSSRLTVENVQKEDEGTYVCAVSAQGSVKNVSKRVRVFDPSYRTLFVNTDIHNLTVMRGQDARWVLKVETFPSPLVYNWEWRNGKGVLLGSGGKFNIEVKGTTLILLVKVASIENAGPYTITITNKVVNSLKFSLDLFLTVNDKPSLTIEAQDSAGDYFLADRTYSLECIASGNPPPTLTWFFIPSLLAVPSGCYTKDFHPFKGGNEQTKTTVTGSRSKIQVEANEHGMWMCRGENVIDSDCKYQPMRVIDVVGEYGFGINASASSFVEGDENVRLTCGLSKLNESKKVEWLIGGEVVTEGNNGLTVIKEESQWTWQSILIFPKLMLSHTALYECRVGEDNRNTTFKLNVHGIVPPTITSSNLNNTERSVSGKDRLELELTCAAEGVPPPEIIWTKDGVEETYWPQEIKRVLLKDGQSLILKLLGSDESGTYQCEARNRGGLDVKWTTLAVEEDSSIILQIFFIAAMVAVVVLLGCLADKKYKEYRLKVYLESLGEKEWRSGDVEKINPELGLEDQANYLPYDSKWEFPRTKLHLGMQLGSGAFGRVLKGEAEDIVPGEKKTTVAVKMVKATADKSHVKALMSELKIMVHLGQHVNVVNLLGACTENLVKKKELLVIVEYCKYGSLLSYLHRHKNTFVDQLDHERGCIDSSITERRPSASTPKLNYASLTFTDVGGDDRKVASNGYRTLEELEITEKEDKKDADYHGNSVSTDMTYLSMYRGDYVHVDVSPINTTDLLAWSFQIARGMEYLASKKVLHGDLAARNVLLADNNVVKICDFGLAKEMYKDDEYKKKTEGGLLPVKWMAIESIYYRVFSTQSDVWSFGVVLWELFTLGRTPYPGMEADERFYTMLREGYRMEKPTLAPSSLYDLMLDCWTHEPTERPKFPDLVSRIGGLMEEGLRQHYVDLNVPYDLINKESHTYQNIQPPIDNGGYLVPITPSQKSVQYVNLASFNNASDSNIPNDSSPPALLANNTGYMMDTALPSDIHLSKNNNGYVRNDIPFKTEERRQKNDSGVGSIDSSHPESPPPLINS